MIYESGDLSQKDSQGDAIQRAVDPQSLGYREGCVSTAKKPLVIEENMFISYASRSDLNAQVRAYAVSALQCFWTNQPLKVLCGATEPVLLDSPGHISSCVYYYGQGSSVNPTDEEDASYRTATALYPTEGTCECSSTSVLVFGSRNSAGLTAASLGGVPVPTYAIGSAARPVYMRFGKFSSKESLGAANQLALDTGITLLRCDMNSMPIFGFGCADRVYFRRRVQALVHHLRSAATSQHRQFLFRFQCATA